MGQAKKRGTFEERREAAEEGRALAWWDTLTEEERKFYLRKVAEQEPRGPAEAWRDAVAVSNTI